MDIKTKLIKDVEELKLMLNEPKQYLINYFNEIENELKSHFAQVNKEHETCIELIQKVEVYKNQFLNELHLTDEIKEQCAQQLDNIQVRIEKIKFDQFEKLFQNQAEIIKNIANDESLSNTDEMIKSLEEMSNNLVRLQTEGIFESIEEFKKNESLKKLIFSNKTFALLRDSNSKPLTLIYYSEKYVDIFAYCQQIVTNDSVKLIKLREFIFQSNKIMIDNFDFKTVQAIDLRFNSEGRNSYYYYDQDNYMIDNLNEIKNDIFNGFINLQYLSLAHMNIKSIEVNTFQNLKNLKYLFLDRNKLTQLDPALFYGLSNLKYLSISRNQLKSIGNEQFRDLVNLIYLNLSSNKISECDQDCFKNLTELKELFLNLNDLDSIDNILNSLKNLKLLDLRGNNFWSNLESIKENCLKSLPEFELIALSYDEFLENNKNNHNDISNNGSILNRNLLKNSSGEFGFNFWLDGSNLDESKINNSKELIIESKSKEFSESGYRFEIELDQSGAAKRLINPDTGFMYSNFVTQHYEGSKYQIIDLNLQEEGGKINDSFMENMKPDIEIGEHYVARNDCCSYYCLKVYLISKNFEILNKFIFTETFDQDYQDDWKQVNHKFVYKNTYKSLRYIIFCHMGHVRKIRYNLHIYNNLFIVFLGLSN